MPNLDILIKKDAVVWNNLDASVRKSFKQDVDSVLESTSTSYIADLPEQSKIRKLAGILQENGKRPNGFNQVQWLSFVQTIYNSLYGVDGEITKLLDLYYNHTVLELEDLDEESEELDIKDKVEKQNKAKEKYNLELKQSIEDNITEDSVIESISFLELLKEKVDISDNAKISVDDYLKVEVKPIEDPVEPVIKD